jgi:tetratricopeptide (TPR) repeat protein
MKRCNIWRSVISLVIFASVASDAGSHRDSEVPPGLSVDRCDEIATSLLAKHDYKQARKFLDASLRMNPSWVTYYSRAITYEAEANWPAALQDLNMTIKLEPAFFEASWERSAVFTHLRNYGAALKELDVLARLTVRVEELGQFGQVLNRRAWLRATCPDPAIRNGRLAVADGTKACQVTHWRNSDYIDTLAAAYAEANDFDSAVRYEDEAITLINSRKDENSRAPGYRLSKDVEQEVLKFEERSVANYVKRRDIYRQHKIFRP